MHDHLQLFSEPLPSPKTLGVVLVAPQHFVFSSSCWREKNRRSRLDHSISYRGSTRRAFVVASKATCFFQRELSHTPVANTTTETIISRQWRSATSPTMIPRQGQGLHGTIYATRAIVVHAFAAVRHCCVPSGSSASIIPGRRKCVSCDIIA